MLIPRSPEPHSEFKVLNPYAGEHGWGRSSDRLKAPRPGGPALTTGSLTGSVPVDRPSRAEQEFRDHKPSGISRIGLNLGEKNDKI